LGAQAAGNPLWSRGIGTSRRAAGNGDLRPKERRVVRRNIGA
jgi:hypothetical protein